MLLLCLLEHAYTTAKLFASSACISSLYIYTYYAAKQSIPLSAPSFSVPIMAVLLGIGMYQFPYTGVIILPISIACLFYKPIPRIFTLHALFCIGCTLSMLTIDSMRYTAKQNLLKKGSHSLQGFVCEIASWTGHSNGCIVTLQLTHIDHQSASGRLKCFLYTPFTAPIGSYVCVYRFSLPITTEQKSSLELYALRDHLLGNYYGPHIKIKILPITTLSTLWAAWWYTWRENLYKKLQTMLPQKTFSYFSSLFLGNKHCDDYTTMRLYFTRWGLTHYLARSGLHISILTSLWIAALTLLPLTHSLKAIILGSVLMLYNYLSWQSISFNRALWIWLLYVGSWLTSTYATPLVALCNITLLILLYNPWYALCADFQLSFFLTAVLMLLSYRREQSFLLSSCIAKKK